MLTLIDDDNNELLSDTFKNTNILKRSDWGKNTRDKKIEMLAIM